jgi:tuftelin-interacting protein 11
MASIYEAPLESFTPHFRKLLEFPREFDQYRLDELVVAAIAPLVRANSRSVKFIINFFLQVRRLITQWSPLEEPDVLVSTFRTWHQALKLTPPGGEPLQPETDMYGTKAVQM